MTTVLWCQEALGTLLLAVFFVAIVIQIIARYAQVPLLWTEEVANYSFIWAIFMGASAMVYHRQHFNFSFFKDRFKGRAGAVYSILVSLLVLAFTGAMFYYGVIVTRTFWNYNWITLPWMKMGYTWLCLPIMGATMSLYLIYHIICDFRVVREREEAKPC